uniref:Uncharacterized protein n=1 Tax=Arundo donax TaxID=35708 RepID=A0A0A8Y0F0_ARUDO
MVHMFSISSAGLAVVIKVLVYLLRIGRNATHSISNLPLYPSVSPLKFIVAWSIACKHIV